MNLKDSLKTNSRVLEDFSNLYGGEFQKGNGREVDCVKIHRNSGDIFLRYVRYTDGKITTYVTEIKSFLPREDSFIFTMKNKSLYMNIKDRLWGKKTSIDYDNGIYENYNIKTNDYFKLHSILKDPKLKYLISGQIRLDLKVEYIKGERCLKFREFGTIRNMNRLQSLVIILEEILKKI